MDSQPAAENKLVFTKLEFPLELMTNKNPTSLYSLGDDGIARPFFDLPEKEKFVAIGRAQSNAPGAQAFFMDTEAFGEAEKTGEPALRQGVNTIDLSPDPDAAERIQVRHPESTAANAPWKSSFIRFLAPIIYTSNATLTVHDLEGIHPDAQLKTGQPIRIIGTFNIGPTKYYRTLKSVLNDQWYGIPITTLTRNDGDIDGDIQDLLDLAKADEQRAAAGYLTGKEKVIAKTAKFTSILHGLFHWGKKS